MDQKTEDILDAIKRFNAEVVAPVAAELDARPNPEDCFSWEIVEQASAAGIRTATLAPRYGGAGVDSLTTAMMVEELAKADMGVSVVLAQTLKIAQTLQLAANEAQRERFLPPFAADPRFLLAIGISLALARYLARPLNSMAKAVHRFAAGQAMTGLRRL